MVRRNSIAGGEEARGVTKWDKDSSRIETPHLLALSLLLPLRDDSQQFLNVQDHVWQREKEHYISAWNNTGSSLRMSSVKQDCVFLPNRGMRVLFPYKSWVIICSNVTPSKIWPQMDVNLPCCWLMEIHKEIFHTKVYFS